MCLNCGSLPAHRTLPWEPPGRGSPVPSKPVFLASSFLLPASPLISPTRFLLQLESLKSLGGGWRFAGAGGGRRPTLACVSCLPGRLDSCRSCARAKQLIRFSETGGRGPLPGRRQQERGAPTSEWGGRRGRAVRGRAGGAWRRRHGTGASAAAVGRADGEGRFRAAAVGKAGW